jgi:hypothetical protein
MMDDYGTMKIKNIKLSQDTQSTRQYYALDNIAKSLGLILNPKIIYTEIEISGNKNLFGKDFI